MSSPYVGEIRCFGFNFAPTNWAFCNGALLSIAQYETLFNLIGTTYGGDGQNTFALPDLRSRVPMHAGNSGQLNSVLGQVFGVESHTLIANETPAHNHAMASVLIAPGGVNEHAATPTTSAFIATSSLDLLYLAPSPGTDATFASSAVTAAGGSQPHENRQPFLALNFCISLFGIYPTQN
jgi:microcystin-dependent protein